MPGEWDTTDTEGGYIETFQVVPNDTAHIEPGSFLARLTNHPETVPGDGRLAARLPWAVSGESVRLRVSVRGCARGAGSVSVASVECCSYSFRQVRVVCYSALVVIIHSLIHAVFCFWKETLLFVCRSASEKGAQEGVSSNQSPVEFSGKQPNRPTRTRVRAKPSPC